MAPAFAPRIVTTDSLSAVTQLALRNESPQKQHVVLATLESLFEQRQLDRLLLTATPHEQASNDEPFAAAALTVLAPDHTANLLAAGCLNDDASPNPLVACLEHLHEYLVAKKITFIQSMASPNAPKPHLEATGYRHLVVLDYRVASPQTLLSTISPNCTQPGVRFVPWTHWTPPGSLTSTPPDTLPETPQDTSPESPAFEALVQLVEETYVDSQDCPRFAPLRTARQALLGYQLSPHHRPQHWFIAVDADNQTPLACLLTTTLAQSHILELTYMGVVPNARGRKLGAACLRKCGQLARDADANSITLAVDRDNHPASQLYEQAGFETLFQESVWGKTLLPAEI